MAARRLGTLLLPFKQLWWKGMWGHFQGETRRPASSCGYETELSCVLSCQFQKQHITKWPTFCPEGSRAVSSENYQVLRFVQQSWKKAEKTAVFCSRVGCRSLWHQNKMPLSPHEICISLGHGVDRHFFSLSSSLSIFSFSPPNAGFSSIISLGQHMKSSTSWQRHKLLWMSKKHIGPELKKR